MLINLNFSESISADSEVLIETVVDGVTVKAIARRGIRSHKVEIIEPFKVAETGQGNTPVYAINAYRKYLEGRDLHQDSVDLVVIVYRQFMNLLNPDPEIMEDYAGFRVEHAAASAALEAAEQHFLAERIANRRRVKTGEIDAKRYQAELTALKAAIQRKWGAKHDVKSEFCMRWYPDSVFYDEVILDTLEKRYQRDIQS
jgi:hypothetical protein